MAEAQAPSVVACVRRATGSPKSRRENLLTCHTTHKVIIGSEIQIEAARSMEVISSDSEKNSRFATGSELGVERWLEANVRSYLDFAILD